MAYDRYDRDRGRFYRDRYEQNHEGFGPEHNYGYSYARGNFGRDNNYPFFRTPDTDPYSMRSVRPSERYESSYDQNFQRYSGTGGYAGRGPKGWRRSDERIREDVCERLALDPYVDASEIEVSVKDGVVALQGSVDTRQTKREAENIIEHISGVMDVRNELSINQGLFQQAKEMLMGESQDRH